MKQDDVRVWADILADILELVPPEQRARVLHLLTRPPQHLDDELESDDEFESAIRRRKLVVQKLVADIGMLEDE
jgi:hypothetical protein